MSARDEAALRMYPPAAVNPDHKTPIMLREAFKEGWDAGREEGRRETGDALERVAALAEVYYNERFIGDRPKDECELFVRSLWSDWLESANVAIEVALTTEEQER